MWIKQAEFKNFGPHQHLIIDFQCGLVGIFGANGRGKSHVTDGIYAALTNDFSRFPGPKADCIRDTAGEKDESSIAITAVHNDIEFVLYRGLRPNKNKLTFADDSENEFTKATEIQQILEERLGVDNRLINQYGFVGQWEMFGFLSQTPGERAKTYQHLCRTTQAQEIVDAVDAMLKQDEGLLETVVDNSDEIQQRIGDLERRLTEHREEREKVTGLLGDEKVEKAEQIVKKRERYDQLEAEHEAAVEARKQAAAKGRTAKGVFEVAEDVQRDAEAARDKHKSTYDEAVNALRDLKRYRKTAKSLDEAREARDTAAASLRDAQAHPPQPPEGHLTAKQLDKLRDKLREDEATLRQHQKFLTKFDDTGVTECPTCGTPTENLQDAIEQTREHVAELEEQIASIEATIEAWHEYNKLAEDHDSLVADLVDAGERHAASIKELEEELNGLPSNLNEETLNAAVEKGELLAEQVITAREARSEAGEQLATVRATYKARKDRVDEIEAGMKENRVSDELLAKAKKALKRHREAEVQAQVLDGKIETVEEALTEQREDLEKLELRLARGKRARQFARTLNQVKEVFHRQALPQVVAQENLEDMEDDINAVLDMFGSPFWVETSEDLSFDVHHPGHPPQSALRLSGGQKSVLAVGFRTAISTLFGSEIGMMVLDEPTAGMDDANVGFLAEALARFAAEVRGKRQVIMITHAGSLRPAFDQVIEIGATDGSAD